MNELERRARVRAQRLSRAPRTSTIGPYYVMRDHCYEPDQREAWFVTIDPDVNPECEIRCVYTNGRKEQ